LLIKAKTESGKTKKSNSNDSLLAARNGAPAGVPFLFSGLEMWHSHSFGISDPVNLELAYNSDDYACTRGRSRMILGRARY
jgi:hypothetical protein